MTDFCQCLIAQVAVDSPGRGQNDAANAHIPHGFHQRHRPADVDGVIVARIQHRFRHRDARREMIDHIHILKQSPQLGAVAHIPARKVDIGRECLRVARGEIVQPAHLMSLAGEVVGKRRAEESRGSGDQKIHDERIINDCTACRAVLYNCRHGTKTGRRN